MANKQPKVPLFLSILFLVISCVAFFLLHKQTKDNNAETKRALDEWQAEATLRNDIRELDHSMKIIEPERKMLDTHFANSSDVVPLLDTLESLATSVGAKPEISSVNIPDDGTALLISMKATGPFTSLYKFLKLLENSSYQLELTSMDLEKTSASADKSELWSMSLSIKLITFIK